MFISAMSAILRDKINELLTENANLERELTRLRESERSCSGKENTPRDISKNTDTKWGRTRKRAQTKTEQDPDKYLGLVSP